MAELPNTALQFEGSDQEECFESSCHDSLKTSSSTCSLEEEEITGATAPASPKASKLFGEDELSESSTLRLEVAEDNDLFQDEETDWWPTPPSLSDVEEHIAARNGDLLGTACDRAIENADALFQRIVRERSTELNELQNAARPVTGTNARDNLLEFFNRALDPSPRPNPNQERSLPEDVQRLVQRSIVTSALRRQGFRSVLEQSLAAQLTTTQRNPLPLTRVPIRRRSPSGTSTPSISAQESDAASITSDATTEHFSDNVSEAASEIEQLQRAIDVGVQALSETIEEDLTQLHHLHVVSTALGGDFRDNLERLVQQRVSSVGGGELVQRFIRSLPSAPIPQPRTQPRTPTAARRNSSQPVARGSHLNLPSEIASLKQQVDEMKRVMQMSLEMQMDTQRAIRQEVSAVFGAFMQQMAQASASGLPAHQTTAPSNNPTPVTAGSCVICLDQQVDTVLYQCGHMCVCNGCGLRLKMQGHKCPMCRAPIRDVIRAYKSQ